MKIQFQNNEITVFESCLYRTTSTVINLEDCIIIVDPNYFPHEIDSIKKHVKKLDRGQQKFLYFTHSDFDHIVGYRAFDHVKVIASKAFVQSGLKDQTIEKIKTMDDDFYIIRDHPVAFPEVDIVISGDREALKPGNTHLIFYQAPGHNADSMFMVIEDLGIFICGDYLSNIEFPFIYHSFNDYIQTMYKLEDILENYNIRIMIPGHGDASCDSQEMWQRLNDSINYLLEIKKSVEFKLDFDEKKLWEKYKFPISMKAYHRENLVLLSKELASK